MTETTSDVDGQLVHPPTSVTEFVVPSTGLFCIRYVFCVLLLIVCPEHKYTIHRYKAKNYFVRIETCCNVIWSTIFLFCNRVDKKTYFLALGFYLL